MQIVIDIPEDTYNHLRNGGSIGASLMIENVIKNGTPLPKGAEILTKEAYSDLCMRASRTESEDKE